MTETDQPSTVDSRDGDQREEAPASAVLRAAGRVSGWVRGSWLYEWLTAEPEPEVIVIDLRETYTVGPFIRLLDAAVDRLQPYWEASTPKRLVDAAVRAGERVAETRVGGIALALLAPPEPPQERRMGDERAEASERSETNEPSERSETDGTSEAADSETDDPSPQSRWRAASDRRDG